jgi:hypothetical protein
VASLSLIKTLSVTAQIYGKDFTPEAAMILAGDLSEFPEQAVLVALSRCRKELRFFPTLAEIIARIDDGRPGTEEAWAMLPKDESASVVWTDEMAEAYGIARDLMDTDHVAARMAFKESYLRLVNDSREHKRPVRWTPSIGHDPRSRERALVEAVSKGRISHDHAQEFLPDNAQKGSMVALLETAKQHALPAPEPTEDIW